MESTSSKETITRERVSIFLKNNSDLPSGVISNMIDTNTVGFDTRPIDFLDSKKVDNPNRLDLAGSLTLVHLTDYQPVDNCILPRSDLGKDIAGKYRSTVHMTMGYPVISHGAGNWQEKKFLVITPLKPQLGIAVGYKSDDVILAGPVLLNEETLVREVSQKEREEIVIYMIENGIIDRGTFVKLSTQNGETEIPDIVSDDWEIDTQKLKDLVKPDSPFYQTLMHKDTLTLSRCMDSPLQMIAVAEMIRIGKIPLVYGFDKSVSPRDVLTGKVSIEDPNTDFYKYGRLDTEIKILINGNESRVDHLNTPWKDLERLFDVVSSGINSNFEKFSDKNERTSLIDTFAGLEYLERLDKAIKSVSIGGELWKVFVGKYILKPKLMIYSMRKLEIIKNDLKKCESN